MMPRDPFVLEGFHNPLGLYPFYVTPIGTYHGSRVALFAVDDGNVELRRISSDIAFEPLSPRLRALTSDFDCRTDRLLAFSRDAIIAYAIEHEPAVFLECLRHADFGPNDPEIRYVISLRCQDVGVIAAEFVRVVRHLAQADLDLARDWQAGALEDVLTIAGGQDSCFPHTLEAALASPPEQTSELTPFVFPAPARVRGHIEVGTRVQVLYQSQDRALRLPTPDRVVDGGIVRLAAGYGPSVSTTRSESGIRVNDLGSPARRQQPAVNVLVVGPDPLLKQEFESAASRLTHWRPVVQFVPSPRLAIEAARRGAPDIVCMQLGSDGTSIQKFSEELRTFAPGSFVVALYRAASPNRGEVEHSAISASMQAHVRDFVRRPLTGPDLQHLFDRLLCTPVSSQRELGRVVSFISNRGGVGTSTMSVSVACEIARRLPAGHVLLVDASLNLGSCAPMLDLVVPYSLAHAARERNRLDETLLRKLTVRHECGLDLLGAPIDAAEAADIDDEALSRTLTLARRTYDWVIVDTFPMLDGMIMAILDLSDRAYVVVQNTVPNVIGAARLLPVIQHLGFPTERTRVVLNNNFERAPGGLRLTDVEARLDADVDFVIPYQKRLIAALNTGRPYILHGTQLFGFGRVIKRIVDDLLAGMPATSKEINATSTTPLLPDPTPSVSPSKTSFAQE